MRVPQGGGVRAPRIVAEGDVLVVDVANGATQVEVSEAGGGAVIAYPVGPDGKARIPVTWPGGSALYVSTGRWPSIEVITVEVIAAIR